MIAIGVGANSRAHEQDFAAALIEVRAEAGADLVATFDSAVFAKDLRNAAHQLGFDYRALTLDALRERNGECQARSERTLSLFGVASIAEASALAGAGPGSHLIMTRRIIGNVTIAAAGSADERGRRA